MKRSVQKTAQTDAPDAVERSKKRVRVGSVLSGVALAAAVALCLLFLIQVLTLGYVHMFGYSLFRVVTPSMEPTISVNALLVCRETDIEDVRADDIVCFRSKDPSILGRAITHRVVRVLREGGEVRLETMGDANPAPDSYFVTAANLIGRVTWYTEKTNFLTSLVALMNNSIGFLACIVFPSILIACLLMRKGVRNIRSEMQSVLEELDRTPAERQTPPEPEITPEEYRQMYERIRKELLEELRRNALGKNLQKRSASPEGSPDGGAAGAQAGEAKDL